MSRVERTTEATPQEVWAVLADGWLYPLWVVGASRIRGVDPGWPQPGTCLHHSFGLWPMLIDDTTEVVSLTEHEHLQLRARGWPAGEARVDLYLSPDGDGTRVAIDEEAVRGPGSLVPDLLEAPLVAVRNREALRRLAMLAEGRSERRPGA